MVELIVDGLIVVGLSVVELARGQGVVHGDLVHLRS